MVLMCVIWKFLGKSVWRIEILLASQQMKKAKSRRSGKNTRILDRKVLPSLFCTYSHMYHYYKSCKTSQTRTFYKIYKINEEWSPLNQYNKPPFIVLSLLCSFELRAYKMQYILPKILVGQQYACYGVAVNHIAKVKNDGDIVNTTRINVFSKLNDRLLLGTWSA